MTANIFCVIRHGKSWVQGRDSAGFDERGRGMVCECSEQFAKEMGVDKGKYYEGLVNKNGD